MPCGSHLVRRGAVYYWRRRFGGPALGCRAQIVTVSLATKDKAEARRRGARMTLTSEQVAEDIRRGRLTPDEAKAILVAVARSHADKLALAADADRVRAAHEPMSGERADRIVGAVYRLLAERGRSASLSEEDGPFLVSCGLDPRDARQVATTLETFRMLDLVPPRTRALEALVAAQAPDRARSALALAQAETAYYRGMAAACLDTAPRWAPTIGDDIALARTLRDTSALAPGAVGPERPAACENEPRQTGPVAPAPADAAMPTPVGLAAMPATAGLAAVPAARLSQASGPQAHATASISPPGLVHPTFVHPTFVPPPVAQNEVVPMSHATRDPAAPTRDETTIENVAEDLCKRKTKLGEWSAKTASQARQTATLFVKITGVRHLGRVRQTDAARFVDFLLHDMPSNYGKSAKDKERSLAELVAAARERADEGLSLGLEPGTLNRHLTHLGNILGFADARGKKTAEPINLTVLRARKRDRDRDKRPAFARAELEALFRSPVFCGSASEEERFEPGNLVVHDSLYFAPMIATYAMMRREEICGLMIEDVVLDHPVPHFEVRQNKYRRLKNAQSRRLLPIHPELLRLGLADYVAAIGAVGYDLLFPELLPASEGTPLGDQFYDDWRPMLLRQVPDAAVRGQVFHSIRHSGNAALTEEKVMVEWRQDILGQGGQSEAAERYREAISLELKLEALMKLPIVTGHLEPAPIRLRRSVMIGKKRLPRPGSKLRPKR